MTDPDAKRRGRGGPARTVALDWERKMSAKCKICGDGQAVVCVVCHNEVIHRAAARVRELKGDLARIERLLFPLPLPRDEASEGPQLKDDG